nr:immunoglobulin light chain junction region [Macaca mulatta]MOW58152.1 immunoglobulin light chain junction region [Macaca mulatta]
DYYCCSYSTSTTFLF